MCGKKRKMQVGAPPSTNLPLPRFPQGRSAQRANPTKPLPPKKRRGFCKPRRLISGTAHRAAMPPLRPSTDQIAMCDTGSLQPAATGQKLPKAKFVSTLALTSVLSPVERM